MAKRLTGKRAPFVGDKDLPMGPTPSPKPEEVEEASLPVEEKPKTKAKPAKKVTRYTTIVKVPILACREKPSRKSPSRGQIYKGEEVTITSEATDANGDRWGLLSVAGLGWIALEFTTPATGGSK